MTSTIITNKLNINLLQGKQVFSEFLSLEEGTCVGLHLVLFNDPNPAHAIDVSIRDAHGNHILNPTDYRDCLHKNGGYLQGMKQLHFKTDNNKFNILLHSETPLTADLKGQLIFIIQKDCGCANSH